MSSEKIEYIQCRLEKWTVDSTDTSWKRFKLTEIAYIPEEFAIKDNKIKLKDQTTNIWDEGWMVAEVFKETKTIEPPDWRKLIRGHRKNTGDSLSKE